MVPNMTEENPYSTPRAELIVAKTEELAPRMARLGGAMIDTLITIAVVWTSMYYLGMFSRAMEGALTIQDTLVSAAIGLVSYFSIHGYLLANHGQTVGKRIANTRIVSVDTGEILPFWKLVLLRYVPVWVVNYIPIAGPILNLINPLFIFRKDRRCVHDHIAGTRVVDAK